MTDDKMPTNIHAIEQPIPEKGGFDFFGWREKGAETTEYTRVHNNPDYYVIKKSDVDGDVMRDIFEYWLTGNNDYPHLKHKSFGGNYLHEESAMKWDGFKNGFKSALIAQSDPDMVRVPMKVLDDVVKSMEHLINEVKDTLTTHPRTEHWSIKDRNNYPCVKRGVLSLKSINNVLNKEG